MSSPEFVRLHQRPHQLHPIDRKKICPGGLVLYVNAVLFFWKGMSMQFYSIHSLNRSSCCGKGISTGDDRGSTLRNAIEIEDDEGSNLYANSQVWRLQDIYGWNKMLVLFENELC